MSNKITTADCINAIVAAWPSQYGEDSDNFRRLFKIKDRGTGSIVRIFFHRELPLQAIVIEKNNAITETTIKGLAEWDIDSGYEGIDDIAEMVQSKKALAFLQEHELLKASDFLFHVMPGSDPDDDMVSAVMLTPTSYWKRERRAYDGQLDFYVGHLLPDNEGEGSDGTFDSALSEEELRTQMLARGFVEDKQYNDFILSCQSGQGGSSDDDDDGDDE